MKRAVALGCIALVLALHGAAALAHDAFGGEARKAYLARLDALHRVTQSAADASTRAQAHFQIARLLDDVRERLNHDLLSHGKTQGLETRLLVQQLNTSPTPLVLSSTTRLYAADLKHYRAAIALDARGPFVPMARFMIFKGQFYESFTGDPLAPTGQTGEDLRETIDVGEALLRRHDSTLDHEELAFVLALRYLQAERAGLLPQATTRQRVAELMREFRQRHPNSLKLATLQALAP